MTNRPLGAQISHMLKARGVDVIFGIPGVHNQELYRGIEEAQIMHVLARHEQGAAFMADGFARATGRFGVCYLITGPGMLNALTPLGQAYSDNVSVLAICSCLDNTVHRKGQLHQMKDQEGAAAAVCDWSQTARDAATAYGLVDRALQDFTRGDPRPKAVHVPIETLVATAPAAPDMHAVERDLCPSLTDISTVGVRLQSAKRPLFIVGGGAKALGDVHPASDQSLMRDLMDRFGAASFCTFAGRGIVAPDHPLHFGPFLTRPGSADVIAQADLVIAIGTQLAEVDIWRDHLGHQDGALIRVDVSDEALATPVGASVTIKADALSFAESLLDYSDDWADAPAGWDATNVAQMRARWRTEVDAEFPNVLPVMDALRAAMPSDVMIYSDMTQFAYAAKECWDMARAGHWHHPSGFGTLGYSLPAAIGGAVARPGLPTLCIIGDYGVQYTIAELATVVELGLPLPIIIWDNGKLGAIEDSMISAQIAPNAVIQQNPDFMALAKAYGAQAVQPETIADIAPAVTAAFGADGPTVIRLTPALVG